MGKGTFLTETQARVLEFRMKGLTQAEIARIRVKLSTLDVISKIREGVGDKLYGRSVTQSFDAVLTSKGELFIT